MPYIPKRLSNLATECHLELLRYSVILVNRDRPNCWNTRDTEVKDSLCDGVDGGWWGKDKTDKERVGLI